MVVLVLNVNIRFNSDTSELIDIFLYASRCTCTVTINVLLAGIEGGVWYCESKNNEAIVLGITKGEGII